AFYGRTLLPPVGATTKSASQHWLYNATAAIYASQALSFYGSYSRGLEDSPQAPQNAANSGQAVPANITEQVDAGFRYAFTPRLRFVAGVFQIKKPFLDRDAANIYTTVGQVKNQGIEASLSGQLADDLTVIAGGVFLKARVSGLLVNQGLIANIPVGTTPR